MKTRHLWFLAGSIFALVPVLHGCGEETPDGPPGAGAQAEEMVHDTIVTLGPDGATTVREMDIPVSERLRQIKLRTLQLEGNFTASINQDPSCQGAAMWLFDQAQLGGARICFIASPAFSIGVVALASHGWLARVRSLWAGQDVTLFVREDQTGTCADHIDPWQRVDVASPCTAKAAAIYFN
jgi:hypothetical protein